MKIKKIKVALVHDWLNGMRGGEKVLENLCEIFPQADIFTLHSDLSKISACIKKHPIKHSFIQYIPGKKKFYRWLLPFFPLAIKQFDFGKYDLIISTSHCAAKNIQVPKNTPHICYCFSPMRYIWALQKDYFGKHPFLKVVIKPFIKWLKSWDLKHSKQVTHFIAVSKTIQKRIENCYNRTSTVIYPPCDIDFTPNQDKKDYLLILSALTPYKRIDLAIQAANVTKTPLIIAGAGPELKNLKKIAGKNITFLGWVSEDKKQDLLKHAKALIFPGFEDFGIVPLEALSFATPVIGFNQGGLTETVNKQTGILFAKQDKQCLIDAIKLFGNKTFNTADFKNSLLNFSPSIFADNIKKFIENIK